jgi:hypothetical protein
MRNYIDLVSHPLLDSLCILGILLIQLIPLILLILEVQGY